MTTRDKAGRPSPWGRLIIADPGLTDSLGHHLGYSVSVGDAAMQTGLPATILANAEFVPGTTPVPIIPAFSTRYQSASTPSRLRGALYGLASQLPPEAGHAVAQGLRSMRRLVQRSTTGTQDMMGRELAVILAGTPDARGALLLLHSVSAANLASLPDAVSAESIAGLAVVLRRTVREMDTTDAAQEPIAAVMRRLRDHWGERLRIFADTDDLAIMYRAELGQPVATVPLPVMTPPVRQGAVGCPPHLVYAGGARAEKGYHHLPGLIERLRDKARFTVHSGVVTDNADPLVQRAHRTMRTLAQAGSVTLIERSLPPDDYLDLIGTADLLLLPYDGDTYGPRSSGILAEARAMGVPAIVPAGCWMARCVGAARSLIFDGQADIRRAVEAALADMPGLAAAYRDSAMAWRREHNPARVFATLAGCGEPDAHDLQHRDKQAFVRADCADATGAGIERG